MLHKPKVGMNERCSRYRAINVVHHNMRSQIYTRTYTTLNIQHTHTHTHTGVNVRTRPSAFFLNKKRPKEIRVKKKKKEQCERSKFLTYYSIVLS